MKQVISVFIGFFKEHNQIMQISVHDPYFDFVLSELIDTACVVPLCINYDTIMEDSMIGKREF